MSIISGIKELQALCTEIEYSGRFSLDLEFIPEKSYTPELCLVQVATDRGAHIIDPLALKDLMPLWEKVADPEILVILHAAEQDLDLCYRYSGLVPRNIFDTQIAAGFAGYGYPVAYAKLVNWIVGVTLSKTESFSDWLLRPLSQAQIEYALDDVRHLLPTFDFIKDKLNERNRLDWVKEECQRFCAADYYEKDRSLKFLKIKGASSLSRRGMCVLKEIFDWREGQAQKINRPARFVLGDNILLELSRKPPKKPEDISRLRGIRPELVQRHGHEIIEAVKRGQSMPESQCPSFPYGQVPPKSDLLQGDVVFLVTKVLCAKNDLAPELVATRDELQYLIRLFREGKLDGADIPILKGWRYELVGKHLLAVLAGAKVAIQLTDNAEPINLSIDD